MIPFELMIHGTPVSLQSQNRARLRAWKPAVTNAAVEAANGAAAVADDVGIEVAYYYLGDTPDVDNVIKSIRDALNGVVFANDNRVVDTRSRKSRNYGSFKIVGSSAVLFTAFGTGTPFLHLRLTLLSRPTGPNRYPN